MEWMKGMEWNGMNGKERKGGKGNGMVRKGKRRKGMEGKGTE